MAAVDAQAVKDRALRALRGFSASQIVIIAMLGVVALVGSVAFLRWVSAPTYQVLLAGLEAQDAAAVTAQLDTDGVAYRLEAGGATVLVPAAQLDAERLKVAAAGLPAGKTDAGWAVFDGQGMTSSSFQQQVAYQRAMEGTLGQTLTGIDGVTSATVHLALPEKKVFTDQQEPTRASVLLDTTRTLDGSAVDAVTRLVASSVPGLAPEDVSVSDSGGHLLTSDGAAGASDRQAQTALEDALGTRASTMLDALLGPGHAVVRVSAELDTSTKTVDSEVYDDTKSAVLGSSTTLETYATPGEQAAAGVVATPSPTATATTPGTGGYRKETSDQQRGVSRTVTREQAAAGGVKRLTVAVAVDRNAQNAPSTPELEALVANAVGLDTTRGDTIAVSTPSFVREATAADAGAPGAGLGGARQLLPSVLGGVLLLLVALGLLRTVRRGTSRDVHPDEVTAALVQAGAPPELAGAAEVRELPAGSVPAQRDGSDDLLRLVDDNPDEVAAMLRGWMASAGGDR